MKFIAALFAAAAATANAGALPAPFPAPSPMDPPAPAGDRPPPPAPSGYYSSGGMFPAPSKVSDLPSSPDCQAKFSELCADTTGKDCTGCVTDNAMALVGATCDTLQLITKACPAQRRHLRRNLVDLEVLPAPFPAPSPQDPPAPAEGHVRVAPAPRFAYDGVQWSPAPLSGGADLPADEAACANIKVGDDCSYLTDVGDVVKGACVANGDVTTCKATADVTPSCAEIFSNSCAGIDDNKMCAQCVVDHAEALGDSGCDVFKTIASSC